MGRAEGLPFTLIAALLNNKKAFTCFKKQERGSGRSGEDGECFANPPFRYITCASQENSVFCLWFAEWEGLGKVLGEVMTVWSRVTATETKMSN